MLWEPFPPTFLPKNQTRGKKSLKDPWEGLPPSGPLGSKGEGSSPWIIGDRVIGLPKDSSLRSVVSFRSIFKQVNQGCLPSWSLGLCALVRNPKRRSGTRVTPISALLLRNFSGRASETSAPAAEERSVAGKAASGAELGKTSTQTPKPRILPKLL